MRNYIFGLLLLIFGFCSIVQSSENDGRMTGGVHLGMPAFLNVNFGYENQQYGFKIAGMYSGNRETNDYWWNNGVHMEAYKNLGQAHRARY